MHIKPVIGSEFGSELCEALGIPTIVAPFEINIQIPSDGVVVIEVKAIVTDESGEAIISTFKKYSVVDHVLEQVE